MKTFKWTVPEMPMTEREKNPPHKKEGGDPSGLGRIALVALILTGIMHLSVSEGFGTGIRSYFWKQGEGRVVSSELISYTNTGVGKVSYVLELDGEVITQTANVLKKWSWGQRVKYDTWAQKYKKGEAVKVYYNGSGKYSLGHWPGGFPLMAVTGLIYLAWGVLLTLKEVKKTEW